MPEESLDIPRLHLNEHLSPDVAEQLRWRGFDVTSSQEEGLLKAPDEQQFAFCVAHRRAIVTFNIQDFMAIHAQYLSEGKNHWGIILSDQQGIAALIRRLLRLLNALTVEDLRNQVRWLNDFK